MGTRFALHFSDRRKARMERVVCGKEGEHPEHIYLGWVPDICDWFFCTGTVDSEVSAGG